MRSVGLSIKAHPDELKIMRKIAFNKWSLIWENVLMTILIFLPSPLGTLRQYRLRAGFQRASYAHVLMCGLISFFSQAYADDALSTVVVHPLQISKHPSVGLSDADVNGAISQGSTVLAQCNSRFVISGALADLSGIPATINSDSDMDVACLTSIQQSSDDINTLGVPRKVRVVNTINVCGGVIRPNWAGCAEKPGNCMVVRRANSTTWEGILWTHEFGHTKGLSHSPDTKAVMFTTVDASTTGLTAAECSALRSLGFNEPLEVALKPSVKLSIESFVSAVHVDGVLYDEARLYTSKDVQKVVPWLVDRNKMEYWSNIVAVVGIVADQRAFQDLTTFIDLPASGVLPLREYEAKFTAIMSMGYVVRGSGSSEAREYLKERSDPSKWTSTQWRAPYHKNDAERDKDLAVAAFLGLGLTGEPQIMKFLQSIQDRNELANGSTDLKNALKQAMAELSKTDK